MTGLGDALTGDGIDALVVYNCNPAVVCPDTNAVTRGLARDDLFTVVLELMPTDTMRVRRRRAPGDDPARASRRALVVGPLLPVAEPSRDPAARRDAAEHRDLPPARDGDGLRRARAARGRRDAARDLPGRLHRRATRRARRARLREDAGGRPRPTPGCSSAPTCWPRSPGSTRSRRARTRPRTTTGSSSSRRSPTTSSTRSW